MFSKIKFSTTTVNLGQQYGMDVGLGVYLLLHKVTCVVRSWHSVVYHVITNINEYVQQATPVSQRDWIRKG